jgi:ketosteroid isomerase-like protein
MSQENVEVVRRVFDSINLGDVDGALEAAADDFELDWSNSIGPAKGVYRGKEQVREVWTSFLEAFGALRGTPKRSSRWTSGA